MVLAMGLGDRIVHRLDAVGITQTELARRVGLKQPSINHLIKKGARGSAHLHKIARELRTTPEYLSGEIDDPSSDAAIEALSSEEREWIDALRGLAPADRKAILQIARTMATMAVSPALNAPRLPFRGEED